MSIIQDIIQAWLSRIGADVASVGVILSMLIMCLIMSTYEYFVYRSVSHKSMYNKSFHISVMILPLFIGSIIMALQSNIVISLGTIGALAIIRFRTAIKDPVDMIFVLWSIFVGITCGCQLYELCILTSGVATIVLMLANLSVFESIFRNPYVLVINSKENVEEAVSGIIKTYSKKNKLKSRNYSDHGFDYVYELYVDKKDIDGLLNEITAVQGIERYSLVEYDSEDIV